VIPEKQGLPRLKSKKQTFGDGIASTPTPGTPSIQIRRPVSYEERVLLAWANTDEDLRTLTKASYIGGQTDTKLGREVEFIIDWNMDIMHPYWSLFQPNGRSFEDELRVIQKITNIQERIRAKHQLAEDLMDFLGMELQKSKQRMKGFPEDEDLMAYADTEYK
jgi:hypothetical protein